MELGSPNASPSLELLAQLNATNLHHASYRCRSYIHFKPISSDARFMKSLLLFVIISFALSGCASTPAVVALPDGSSGYSVSCNGTARTISDCMNAAAKFCRGPYKIFTEESKNAGGYIIPNTNIVAPLAQRSLIFTCGGSQ